MMMGRYVKIMRCASILPVKVSVTIDLMSKRNGDSEGDGTCKQTLSDGLSSMNKYCGTNSQLNH